MRCPQKRRMRTNEVDQYAMNADFERIFTDEFDRLYLLAFLLTANHEKAELCFVAGLSDSVEENQVFRDWARSWAKRAVIQRAIHEVRPHASLSESIQARALPHISEQAYLTDYELYRVLTLDDFERFVFVMSVLERYSDQETSVLLGCTPQQVQESRMQAILQISVPFLSPATEKPVSTH